MGSVDSEELACSWEAYQSSKYIKKCMGTTQKLLFLLLLNGHVCNAFDSITAFKKSHKKRLLEPQLVLLKQISSVCLQKHT